MAMIKLGKIGAGKPDDQDYQHPSCPDRGLK